MGCLTDCAPCETERQRIAELQLHAVYLDACLSDSLRRNEAPFASHGLYTRRGVLDDAKPEERERGIRAGFAWREASHASCFYVDLFWSGGMGRGREAATELVQGQLARHGHALHMIEERQLEGIWRQPYAWLRDYLRFNGFRDLLSKSG
jgi:hypothetical protein